MSIGESRPPSTNSPKVPETRIAVSDVNRIGDPLAETTRLAGIQNLLFKPKLDPLYTRHLERKAKAGDREATEALRVAQDAPRPAIEACLRYEGSVVDHVVIHPVIAAAGLAYQLHRPLVLTPDIMWLLIAQGAAHHIRLNAEKLRKRFVRHDGVITLTVRRDDFVKGAPENPWENVFEEFVAQIGDHGTDEARGLLIPDFSTTGAPDRAAAGIVLMDAMQLYYRYELMTLCGIPEVILKGTSADWERVAARTEIVGKFGMEWWTGALRPILSQFVAASHGLHDRGFWRDLYKIDGHSGGPDITGWITAFFPYVCDGRERLPSHENPGLSGGSFRTGQARFNADEFPNGLSAAPFTWLYLGAKFQMEFLGGFSGVTQDADSLRLTPEIGWAVRDASRK